MDDVAEGYAGLEEHGCEYTDEQKMATLLSNLHLEPSDAYLLTYCRDTYTTFEQCYQYLRKEATCRTHDSKIASTRKVRMVMEDIANDDDRSELGNMIETYVMNAMSKDMSKAYKPSSTNKSNGKYWIEKPIFKLIKETFGISECSQTCSCKRQR